MPSLEKNGIVKAVRTAFRTLDAVLRRDSEISSFSFLINYFYD